MNRVLTNLLIATCTISQVSAKAPSASPLELWFDAPGAHYTESCVLGNGRLGAMDLGGVEISRIVLNESSVWSGGKYESNRKDAWKCLPEVRAKLFAGDADGAYALLSKNMRYPEGVKGWFDVNQFGCYQTLGDLTLHFGASDKLELTSPSGHAGGDNNEIGNTTDATTDYVRKLNMMHGVSTTSYTKKGVVFTRELLVSKPDEVIALRLTASKPGALTLSAGLSRKQQVSYRSEKGLQIMEGQLSFNKPGGGGVGVKYQAQLAVQIKGGSVSNSENGFDIKNADEVLLLVSAGTNLRNPTFPATLSKRLAQAQQKPFNDIAAAAKSDHAALMGRCQLNLPDGPNSHLPIPERVKLAMQTPDPALEALYFQFGRHLMVSGSRPDSPFPTNLQGIWADEYSPAWRGDFHSNINLQMNYWLAEVGNLSECHLPLIDFIGKVAKEGEKTAEGYYNAPGWMANHTQNAWYDTAPSYLPACFGPVCGAWLTQHIWQHYDFTRDLNFLQANYLLLRGAAEFMQAVLVEDPKTGKLVTAPSNSPENKYTFINKDGKKQNAAVCYGATFDQQITRELFENTASAARLLGIDRAFANSLDATRAKLAPTRLGRDGRIMEWQEEFDEPEPTHRHVSHLWGLYPGSEINPAVPDLFEGAKKTLERRGDASTGWSMAWKANFWARLHDGDRARKLLAMLIGRGYANMFDKCPPFQIDGNFGGAAAVAEMLLQSQEVTKGGHPVLELLPALPSAWTTGNASGLKARGNFEVDLAWKDGQLTTVTIHSIKGTPAVVRYQGKEMKLAAKPATIIVNGELR